MNAYDSWITECRRDAQAASVASRRRLTKSVRQGFAAHAAGRLDAATIKWLLDRAPRSVIWGLLIALRPAKPAKPAEPNLDDPAILDAWDHAAAAEQARDPGDVDELNP